MIAFVEAVSSLERPELQPYRTLRLQVEHRRQGIFVAEGEKLVRRILESRFTVESVLLPEKWFEALRPLLEARPELIQVYTAPKPVLETLTGFSMYQGLMAVGRIPQRLSLDGLIASAPAPRLLVALDGISNADNVGAIVRNAVAFGAHGLISADTSCSPFLRRSVRRSMGAIFELPVVEDARLPEALGQLRARGIRCVAAHLHANPKLLSEANLAFDCCLVLGGEGYGMSEEVLRACDEAVIIPMTSAVDSLNVASAAAIFLYEARRQRRQT